MGGDAGGHGWPGPHGRHLLGLPAPGRAPLQLSHVWSGQPGKAATPSELRCPHLCGQASWEVVRIQWWYRMDRSHQNGATNTPTPGRSHISVPRVESMQRYWHCVDSGSVSSQRSLGAVRKTAPRKMPRLSPGPAPHVGVDQPRGLGPWERKRRPPPVPRIRLAVGRGHANAESFNRRQRDVNRA